MADLETAITCMPLDCLNASHNIKAVWLKGGNYTVSTKEWGQQQPDLWGCFRIKCANTCKSQLQDRESG
jgi:hypothetical protein